MRVVAILLWSLWVVTTRGGEFINLGFDAANVNELVPQFPYPDAGFGKGVELLPGWNAYAGTNLIPTDQFGIGLNAVFEQGGITVVKKDAVVFLPTSHQIESGYGLLLNSSGGVAFSVEQTGFIPSFVDTLQLAFDGKAPDVSIDGERLRPREAMPEISPGRLLVSYEISRFAGRDVELRLSMAPPSFVGQVGGGLIDSIGMVPEPSSSELLILLILILTAGYYGKGPLSFKRESCAKRVESVSLTVR